VAFLVTSTPFTTSLWSGYNPKRDRGPRSTISGPAAETLKTCHDMDLRLSTRPTRGLSEPSDCQPASCLPPACTNRAPTVNYAASLRDADPPASLIVGLTASDGRGDCGQPTE